MAESTTQTAELDWFALDRFRADLADDAPDALVDAMDETVRGGTTELTWWDLDAIHQACEEGSAGREQAAELANELA
jgi:hypothetical protein